MTVALVAHPAVSLIEAYALGTLSPLDATEVEEHLAVCGRCCGRLSTVPDDAFVGLLRGSKPDSDEEQECRASQETQLLRDQERGGSSDFRLANAPSSRAEETMSPAAAVPQALFDHPRYRILEPCGVGGMGVVYRAEHRLMNREVAIKVIRPELLRRPEAVERFRREVQAAAALSHPHIVSAHDAEESAGLHFLVMEYVPGSDLSSLVTRRGPLPVREACVYLQQAAQGLAHAHRRGMVHRDIKPQNLMRTPDGQVKILDFGLSKFASEAEAPTRPDDKEEDTGRPDLTNADASLGTPDYVAPEQTAHATTADVRADIYGLGGTLYFLLTGRPPFPGRSVVEKLRGHAEETPRAIRDFRNDVPSELVEVLERMLAKRQEHRYQTPDEVVEALQPFVVEAGSAGVALRADPPAIPPSRSATEEDEGDARRKVESPANGILAVTVLNLVLGVWSLSTMPHVYPREDLWSIWAAVGGISMLPATLIMMQGALRMRRLESYAWAQCAGIYAVVPWTPVWFLGLPFGLWALWTLRDPTVRRGFGLDSLSLPVRRRQNFLTGLFLLLPIAAGAGGVVYIETDKGEIAIEAHDPAARIRVLRDGKLIEILDPVTKESVTVDTGVYTVQIGSSGFKTNLPENEEFVIHRGKRKLVTVQRVNGSDTLAGSLPKQFSLVDTPLNTHAVELDEEQRAWKIDGLNGRNVRLYEVDLPNIDDRLLIYGAKLKARNVTGRAYLEMWVRSKNGQKYFSRGFQDAVHGTTDWVEVQTPFLLKEGETANQALLNVVTEGGGTVWIKDAALRSSPRPKSFSEKAGEWLQKSMSSSSEPENDDRQSENQIREIGRISGPTAPLFDVAFTPDGSRLLASCDDWFLYAIDCDRQQVVQRIPLGGGLRLVDVSHDGRLAAVGGILDGALPIADLETGTQLRRLEGHREHVRSASFSADGLRLASQSPSEIVLWDVESATGQQRIETPSQIDQPVLLTPDGRFILSAQDADVRVYRAETGEHVRRLTGHTGRIISLDLSPDGRHLASGSFDAAIRLWDWKTGSLLRVLSGHAEKVTSVRFAPDGQSLISGSHDRTLRIWNVTTGRETAWTSCDTHDVNHVAISPDGRTIATAGGWSTDSRGENYTSEKRPTIRLWEMPTLAHAEVPAGELLLPASTFTGDDLTSSGIYAMAVTPDGSTVVTGHHGGPVRVWDVDSGRQLHRLEGHTASVGAVAISPDGRFALTGSQDATSRLWNLETGEEVRRFSGHDGWIRSVAFSPDGGQILTGAADFQSERDNTLRVWDLETGQEHMRLKGRRGHNADVAFAPDGHRIAAVDGIHNCIRFWDAETGQPSGELGEFRGIVSRLAFSPDGRFLATGEHGRALRDGKWYDPEKSLIRIWDLPRSRVLHELSGHTGAILDVAFSQDGSRLLTVSGDRHDGHGVYFEAEDRTIRLWDTGTGQELARFATGERIDCVAFLPGKDAFVSGGTGALYLWRLPASARSQVADAASNVSAPRVSGSGQVRQTLIAVAAVLAAAKGADIAVSSLGGK